MKDENLEKRKDFLRSLTQQERDYIGKYGFDMFRKKQKAELEAENAELEAKLKEKEVQESLKVTPIEIHSEDLNEYNDKISIAQQKQKDLNEEIIRAMYLLEGKEIREAKDILKGLKIEIMNASSRLENQKQEFAQNTELQDDILKI